MDKPLVFPLIIDKERELMLNIIVQTAMRHPDYIHVLEEYEVIDSFQSFLKDMKEGSDKMPWCNHKDCRGGDTSKCTHKNM